MKTIFLSVYDGDTEKNILRSGVLPILKNSGHRIVLLIRGSDRLEYYREHFGDASVIIEQMPSAGSRWENFWYFIGWSSLPTRAAEIRRHMYRAKGWPTSHYILSKILGFLGQFRLWRETLRFVYGCLPDNFATTLFSTYKPDLVFAPGMFSPEDSRLLRQAKRHGIRTVATAKSWDVLTTKAFTRVKADRLLVFNEINRREAIELGDYDSQRVTVTGFPQFDVYKRPEIYESRESFCARIGADPNKRIVLIAVPGDWLTPHTKDTLNRIDARIDEGVFRVPVQVLARLHPKYPDSSEGRRYKNVIMDRPGTHLSEKREFTIDTGVTNVFSWTFTDADVRHLANSLYHSDVIVNTASTLTLDAASIDKPVVLVGYDGDVQLPYWDSIARVYEREHYSHVVATDAAPLVHSYDALEDEIRNFLNDPNYRRIERTNLQQTMLFATDGRSSERVANAVLAELEQ